MKEQENIQSKTFFSVIWNFINRFGTELLALIPAMILARLISPEDYGVIAMAGIFSGLVKIFVNSGFGMALIQKKDMKHIDICSVFYFNIAISTLLYFILFIVAPLVADFFEMPAVCNIMRVSSLSIIIGAFGNVHNALFTKNLDFRRPTIRNMASQTCGSIVAIILAFMGFGYWALVFQGIVSTTTSTISNWFLSEWRPTFEFSLASLKTMFGFGSKLLGKSLTDFGFAKIYSMTIGKLYSAADLSYFNRAHSTANLLISTFLGVMNSVAFPVFSKMQNDMDRLRTNILRFLLIESMIIFFIMMFAAALATPLFHFMYSSKWDAVIPLFQLLCIWGLLKPLSMIFANGLMATGHSGVCLRNSFIGRGLNVLFLMITWKFGLAAMIIGQVFAFSIEVLLYSQAFNKVFKYNLIETIKDLLPYLAISFCINFAIWFIDRYITNIFVHSIHSEFIESFLRLIVGGMIGLALFLLVYKTLKLKAYCDFKVIVSNVTAKNAILNKMVKKIL